MPLISLAKTESLSDRVATVVRMQLAAKRHSQASLARELEVPQMWVSDRLSGKTQITMDDFDKIAKALGMEPVDLLRAAETVATVQYPDEVTETVAPRPMPRRPPMRHDSRGPGSGRTARTRPPNAG